VAIHLFADGTSTESRSSRERGPRARSQHAGALRLTVASRRGGTQGQLRPQARMSSAPSGRESQGSCRCFSSQACGTAAVDALTEGMLARSVRLGRRLERADFAADPGLVVAAERPRPVSAVGRKATRSRVDRTNVSDGPCGSAGEALAGRASVRDRRRGRVRAGRRDVAERVAEAQADAGEPGCRTVRWTRSLAWSRVRP
jgi:hypothetical protein